MQQQNRHEQQWINSFSNYICLKYLLLEIIQAKAKRRGSNLGANTGAAFLMGR